MKNAKDWGDHARLVGRVYEQLEEDIHDHEVDAVHNLLWTLSEDAIFEYFDANREENDDE